MFIALVISSFVEIYDEKKNCVCIEIPMCNKVEDLSSNNDKHNCDGSKNPLNIGK